MMKNFRLALRTSALFAVTFLFVSGVQAQASRTWVSGVGDDQNSCSRTAPCKSFAGAITKTNTGGEITAMDAGGFGTVIIRKSITIDGTGVPSSILAAQATGITIDIPFRRQGDTKRSVRIRGLAINGLGNGNNGIDVVAARQVSIEDCVIDGFTTDGIAVRAGTLFVRNTTVRNNAGTGVNVLGSSTAAISDSSVIFNGTGLAGAVTKYCCVVLFGNKTGDPPPPPGP
jgi:Right handed beta helix region